MLGADIDALDAPFPKERRPKPDTVPDTDTSIDATKGNGAERGRSSSPPPPAEPPKDPAPMSTTTVPGNSPRAYHPGLCDAGLSGDARRGGQPGGARHPGPGPRPLPPQHPLSPPQKDPLGANPFLRYMLISMGCVFIAALFVFFLQKHVDYKERISVLVGNLDGKLDELQASKATTGLQPAASPKSATGGHGTRPPASPSKPAPEYIDRNDIRRLIARKVGDKRPYVPLPLHDCLPDCEDDEEEGDYPGGGDDEATSVPPPPTWPHGASKAMNDEEDKATESVDATTPTDEPSTASKPAEPLIPAGPHKDQPNRVNYNPSFDDKEEPCEKEQATLASNNNPPPPQLIGGCISPLQLKSNIAQEEVSNMEQDSDSDSDSNLDSAPPKCDNRNDDDSDVNGDKSKNNNATNEHGRVAPTTIAAPSSTTPTTEPLETMACLVPDLGGFVPGGSVPDDFDPDGSDPNGFENNAKEQGNMLTPKRKRKPLARTQTPQKGELSDSEVFQRPLFPRSFPQQPFP